MASSGWQGQVTLKDGAYGTEQFKGDINIVEQERAANTVRIKALLGVYNDGNQSYALPYEIRAQIQAGGQFQNWVVVVPTSTYIPPHQYATQQVIFTIPVSGPETTITGFTVYWAYSNGGNGKAYTIDIDPYREAPFSPVVNILNATFDSVTIEYKLNSFGYPDAGTLELRMQESEDPSPTVIDTKTATGTYTYTATSLIRGGTYSFSAKATNTAGLSSFSNPKTVTLPVGYLYGSANDQSEKIIKMYGPVDNLSKNIIKFYGSENGLSKKIFESSQNQ